MQELNASCGAALQRVAQYRGQQQARRAAEQATARLRHTLTRQLARAAEDTTITELIVSAACSAVQAGAATISTYTTQRSSVDRGSGAGQVSNGRDEVRKLGRLREPDDPLQRVIHVRTPSTSSSDEVAAVYLRTCPQLIGLLTSIGGSRSEAEEVAQDAYVKLLQQWPTIRSYDDPDAWVRTVAVRLLISRHRRATVATLGLRRLASQAGRDESELTPDSVATAAALRTLPVPQRAAVILHYVLDLPLQEVAEQLKLPVGTVKSRLSRARAALAPLLRETEESKHV